MQNRNIKMHTKLKKKLLVWKKNGLMGILVWIVVNLFVEINKLNNFFYNIRKLKWHFSLKIN